ncbi:carbon-nitrogen hydrolase family protein [Paraferrimonas sp. SM1919]|uniref:carbon-nitrogen hydrolase family protein n=1 Tax=Paraferrimonas sp. SM1919 TaxID=2662263 RepID=UPI0013D2032F|nr:carbon-nitrogen hydrolase family protein [Paraferrimonas sp. SM1919]
MRVAAAQFAVGNDVHKNLQTCLRMIAEAAKCQPDLIQLPEFCNHNSWYDNQEHCYEVSVSLDDEFMTAIKQAAVEAGCYLVINCTLRKEFPKAASSNILINANGEIVNITDKQVLLGHENDFLIAATTESEIISTEFGQLGLYCCMDGVINEPPRALALNGAQLICNALNSFAIDEGNMHIPVRAAENKVFVVAANKVGPLIPEELLQPVSQATSIPIEFLSGAGDSQIVAPDGTVLALAGKEEQVIWADIDLSQADNKKRPDGTDIFFNRRPQLYQNLIADPASLTLPEFAQIKDIAAAAISPKGHGFAALEDALEQIIAVVSQGAKLISLPELFWTEQKSLEQVAADSDAVIEAIAGALSQGALAATSIVRASGSGFRHSAVLISENGVVLEQGQVHASNTNPWTELTDELVTYGSNFGRLALCVEDDAIYPEWLRQIAMQGVQTVLMCLRADEAWQSQTGIRERAAENRVNIVAATPLAKDLIICQLQHDFTVMTPWKTRPFDGKLSDSQWITGAGDSGTIMGLVQPIAAANKMVSHRTHLIDNRPWHTLAPLVAIKQGA